MRILNKLLDLLYPPRCAFCHKLTPHGERICAKCLKDLPYTNGNGQKQKLTFADTCVSPLYYEGEVRQSLLRYKFHGVTAYAQVYGEILSKCIDENQIPCDIITWVPLSRKRLRKRGYDQARLIAEEISKRTGIKCECLLEKTINNPAQSGTGGPEKRRANVSGVYEPAAPELAKGRHVLVVDDIVTTGATLSECARILTLAGAAKVTAAAVARSRN